MPARSPTLRLQAVITVDYDAENFLSAAEFQNDMEARIAAIKSDFADAKIDIRERRVRPERRQLSSRPGRIASGNVNRYE